MGGNPLAWLFEKQEEPSQPPEQLVLGAELECRYGSKKSYLIVQADSIDIGNLPTACVLDRKEFENILPFGGCALGAPCEKHIKLEERWENPEPQKTLDNGEEMITTESTLLCKAIGSEGVIHAVTSGQDGVVAEEWLLCCEMEEKYPGLLGILMDQDGSLYLSEEGMYEKAIRFLEDRIQKNGGELPLAVVYTPTKLEEQLIAITLSRLLTGIDRIDQESYLSVLEERGIATGMYNVPGWDSHTLNKEMIEMLKVDCADKAEKIKTNAAERFAEKYKRPLRIAGKTVLDTGYSCMLYTLLAGTRSMGQNAKPLRLNGTGTFEIVADEALKNGAMVPGIVPVSALNSGDIPRVFTSRDPLVGYVAMQIEHSLPGRVISVNKVVYRPDGSILTDLDIELDNIVIQVKTGGGKGVTKQLINSANSTGKTAIGYVPDVKPSVLKEATNNGFDVFTNMDDLIEFISQH